MRAKGSFLLYSLDFVCNEPSQTLLISIEFNILSIGGNHAFNVTTIPDVFDYVSGYHARFLLPLSDFLRLEIATLYNIRSFLLFFFFRRFILLWMPVLRSRER